MKSVVSSIRPRVAMIAVALGAISALRVVAAEVSLAERAKQKAEQLVQAAASSAVDVGNPKSLRKFAEGELAKGAGLDGQFAQAVLDSLKPAAEQLQAEALLKAEGLKPGTELFKEQLAAAAGNTPNPKALETQIKYDAARQQAVGGLEGLGFGLGLGVITDAGSRERVTAAALDKDGILRVTEDANTRVGFMLETHYFFVHDSVKTARNTPRRLVWGHGPMVCAQAGENVIQGVGLGYMVGFKRPTVDGEPNFISNTVSSFNLGVAFFVEPGVQVLGDGLEPGMKLASADEIRFRKTTQGGIAVVFSAAF